jgi:hypothetical protein
MSNAWLHVTAKKCTYICQDFDFVSITGWLYTYHHYWSHKRQTYATHRRNPRTTSLPFRHATSCACHLTANMRERRPGFDFRQGQEILLYSTASRPTRWSTQAPIQWALGAISPGVKRQGREADHSPPSNDEVNNGGVIPPLPHKSSWCGTTLPFTYRQ